MPMLVDNAVDSVIRGMSDDPVDEPDFWDPSEPDDTWLKLWAGNDWWKGPGREVTPGTETTPIKFTADFDPEKWSSKYENGRIPLSAMVRVGKELNGSVAWLRPDAAAAWRAAVAAAAKDGVTLTITDSYRTYAQQVATSLDGGAPSADPGTSNHGWGIALDIGEGAQREWMAKNGSRFGFEVLTDPNEPWHFDFRGQGATGFDPNSIDVDTEVARTRPGTPEPLPDLTLVPASLGVQPNLADITYGLYQDIKRESRPKTAPPAFTGDQADIKEQLYQGFMDANRPDLAKMVRTKDFNTWIGAESGWKFDVVSKYYPGHGRNAGGFQFALLDRDWVWGDVDQSSWTYGATPYEQARMVVKYFDLTPEDIRRYADQIRAGTYRGWG